MRNYPKINKRSIPIWIYDDHSLLKLKIINRENCGKFQTTSSGGLNKRSGVYAVFPFGVLFFIKFIGNGRESGASLHSLEL